MGAIIQCGINFVSLTGDDIMNIREIKNRFFNISALKVVGVLLVFLLAGLLLWHGNATSMQAQMALTAQVYFDGEYRIADGEWQSISSGEHISSTKGDVTLRGNFHILAPDGEYVGVYDGGIPIAFYTDHINLAFREGESDETGRGKRCIFWRGRT